MMPRPEIERFAGVVVENVVSAIGQAIGEGLEAEERRHHVIGAPMREMPTKSERVLVQACNRYVSSRPTQRIARPLIIDVDMGDGPVVMLPR